MSEMYARLVAGLSGRYIVEREIGAGGMATVYLARDLRHKRSIALKVVRPELGGQEGVERFLREIELAAAEESGFLRLQLALALAARPETREEGINSLRYGFDFQPLFIPLASLALGRTYDAAGKPDSAAMAYRRFIRLWDKADPELQGRVEQARVALEEITRERAGTP